MKTGWVSDAILKCPKCGHLIDLGILMNWLRKIWRVHERDA